MPSDPRLDRLPAEEVRTGLAVETLKRAFADNLFYVQGKFPLIATKNDSYMALAYTVRDRLLHHWINTVETYLKQKESKVVCYLSAEFLLGPQLGNNLINLGIYEQVSRAVEESGPEFARFTRARRRAGLGKWRAGSACRLLHGLALKP